MSYILDALKKSEQERGHGNIPDVQTVHSSSLNYRSEKKSYWPYILILAVILNLLAIIYFNYDRNANEATETASSIQAEEVISHESSTGKAGQIKTAERKAVNATVIATTEPAIPPPVATEPVMKQRVMNNPVLPIQSTANDGGTASEKTTEKVSKKPVNTEANTVRGETAQTEKPVQKQESLTTETSTNAVIEFYDLPDSITSQLPSIVISAHVYSTNPEQRSIVINNKFLEEGDYVIDDLILYEITRDGAIFLYNGILFHYGVVSSWQ